MTNPLRPDELADILAAVPEGIITLDRDQRIRLINPAALSIIQKNNSQVIPRQAVINQPLKNFIDHPQLLDLVTSSGKGVSKQAEITCADGTILLAETKPLPDDGMLIILQDITHYKQLARVEDEFILTVFHSLRSPLTSVMGYAELVERVGPVNDVQRKFIQRVHESVKHITRMMDDLLNLRSIETSPYISREKLELTKIILDTIEHFRQKLDEKQIEVKVKLPDPDLFIAGNNTQISRMMGYLLENAINFSKPGGDIEIQALKAPGTATLRITDHGIGIPAPELPHIFDKFYRASNAGDAAAGNGLGLPTAKAIIERHGGQISVDSVIDKGTTVTVVLPMAPK